MKQIFLKNEVVTVVKVVKGFKSSLFVIGPFCSRHSVLFYLFVLILASDRAVLNGSYVFSILVVSTKKRYSSFLKLVFVFEKIWIKVNALKTFKTSDLSNGGLFDALSVGFKMKSIRKRVFEC